MSSPECSPQPGGQLPPPTQNVFNCLSLLPMGRVTDLYGQLEWPLTARVWVKALHTVRWAPHHKLC